MALPRRQSYVLYKDPFEQSRLEKQHEGLLEMQHGTLIHATLKPKPGASMLDIGCGTGVVTLELARRYPSARVIGVDLSDIQNEEIPPNVEYLHGDFNLLVAQKSGPLKRGTFDFTFQRGLILAIRNWPDHMRNMFSVLKPGGVAEVHEFDFRYRRSSRVIIDEEFDHKKALNELMAADGYDLTAGIHMERFMRRAGFVDVEVKGRYRVPFGDWMAETNPETARIGEVSNGETLPAIQEMVSRVLTPAGYPGEEIDRLKQDVAKLRRSSGVMVEFVVTTGRKPTEEDRDN